MPDATDPASDSQLSNADLAPRKISFRIGGLITGIIGIVMMPWKLIADPGGYIFTWLIGYSALLGPIAGIMIADYFVIRRTALDVDALYRADGEYGAFNLAGLGALMLAVLPNLPGFLVTVKLIDAKFVPAFLVASYNYAWFIGFAAAFVFHLLFAKLFSK